MLFGRKAGRWKAPPRMKTWRGDSRPSGRTSPPSVSLPMARYCPPTRCSSRWSATGGRAGREAPSDLLRRGLPGLRRLRALLEGTGQRHAPARRVQAPAARWYAGLAGGHLFPGEECRRGGRRGAEDRRRRDPQPFRTAPAQRDQRRHTPVHGGHRVHPGRRDTRCQRKLPASLRLQPQVAQGPAPPHALLRRVLSGEPGFLGSAAARRILPRAFRAPQRRRRAGTY